MAGGVRVGPIGAGVLAGRRAGPAGGRSHAAPAPAGRAAGAAMSASPAPGDRLTALGAEFLCPERTGQLLHVAGISPVAGALDFQRQVSALASRLHLIPRYTHRVVRVPLGLAHPTWEPD